MQNMDLLTEQIQTMSGRLLDLYNRSNRPATPKVDVLPIALKELGLTSEELQVAVEELTRQNEALTVAHNQIAAERSRYQHLFELAPDALVITTPSGVIQDVNQKAADLLNRHAFHLVGKPIVSLVAMDDRSEFRNALAQTSHCDRVDMTTYLQTPNPECFEASLRVDVIYDAERNPRWLQWQLQDLSRNQCILSALMQSSGSLLAPSQSFECYSKGEVIFLEPQTIWLVVKGVVKLTTLSDSGEDILIGLVSDAQVFGTSLTALLIYQAIALSEVKLLPVSMANCQRSPEMSQVLMMRIVQRLQQTERFVTMQGQLRVQDRLIQFLSILKDALGEPTVSGIRLKARLTHQDFANACCSSRVTMTRLLGKLQQEGKITCNEQNYFVIHSDLLETM
jgi:PAS domain S-box-containing protein